MHIAVCMDVAPDRKQLERLLGRSTDARLAACPDVPYYIQSYGNKDALLARPFMYDLFFIDLQNDEINSIELIRQLRDLGVTATIVLCPGKVDLTGELTPQDDVLILRQPVVREELDSILDQALAHHADKTPKLDIRGRADTELVYEEEFCYAEKIGDGIIDVHLTDDRVIRCFESIDTLALRTCKFADIIHMSGNLIAHRGYIMSTGFGSVELKDGKKFRASLTALSRLKKI